MDIRTATKKAMVEGKGITRPSLNGLTLLPTNTAYRIIGCNPEGIARGWQPSADDLIAEDWQVVSI